MIPLVSVHLLWFVITHFTLFSCRQIIDNVLLEPAELSSSLVYYFKDSCITQYFEFTYFI